MITDTELLARLSKILSPGEIPDVIGRLMRSPLAWDYLHRPSVLAATDQVAIENLTPSRLAFLSINKKPESIRPGSQAQNAEETEWSAVLPDKRGPETIEEAATYALHILHAADHEGWEKEVANVVLSNPAAWQEPMIFAWPHLPADNSLFSFLALSEDSNALMMLCNCLIANESMEEAASRFIPLPLDSLSRIVIKFRNSGEDDLAKRITALSSNLEGSDTISLENRIAQMAVSSTAKNLIDIESSSTTAELENSFEHLSSLQALLADELAETAGAEEQFEKEAVRRKQALLAEPSSLRRALLAQTYNKLGEYTEALAVLSDAYESIEECIAAGAAQAGIGETERAKVLLTQAADTFNDIEGSRSYWAAVLIEALNNLSSQQVSLEVARKYSRLNPGSAQAYAKLAAQFYACGDFQSAVDRAQIGLAMEPDSLSARKTLAQALQAGGKYTQALPHWEKLTEASPEEGVNLALCALDAGASDLARTTAELLLKDNPEDLLAEGIFCQALSRLGKTDEAVERINSLLSDFPHEPALWLAYINVLKVTAADGEIETAFARANQAVLDHPKLLTAYASWLSSRNRYSEALGFAERAFRLDQQSADTAVLYASLLQHMADPKASIVLQKAHELQPRNWELVLDLALLTEAEGNAFEAASLLSELPLHLESEQNLVSGKIFFQAHQQDPDMLEKAILHLQRAADRDASQEASFWLAESLAAAGRGAEARQQYQAFLASSHASGNKDMQKSAFLNLAETAADEGDLILSLTTLESALEEIPADVEVMLPLSQAYLKAGMYQQCMDTAKQILAQKPEHEASRSLLLQAAVESGSEDKAEEVLQKMFEQHPNSPSTWLNAASLRLAQDRLKDVRASAAAALYYGRHDASILIKAGEILLNAGLNDNAVRILRYGINTLPLENDLLRRLAEASEGSNDFQGAQKAWRKYTQQAPQDPDGFLRAALALWKLDRRAAAIELLLQASHRFPDYTAFPLQLAAYQLSDGNPVDARQSYRKAINLSADDPAVLKQAADGFIRLDEIDDAKSLLDSAASMAPDDIDIQLMMMKCLLLQNNSEEAYRILSNIDPDTTLPASSLALGSFASAKEKAYEQAHQLFALAHAQPISSEDDMIWLSRAARALGYWDIGLQVFAGLEETTQESSSAIQTEIQEAWLAAKEADYVLREFCDLRNHAVQPASFNGISLQFSTPVSSLRRQLSELDMTKEMMEEVDSLPDSDLTPEFLTSFAVAQLRSSQPARSLAALHRIHQQTRLDDWQSLLIVIALVNHKQTGMARKTMASLHINPNLKPLLSYLEAASLLLEEDTDGYSKSMTEAVTTWEDEPLWQYQLGEVYRNQEDTASALPHFQQAVLLEPENTVFLRSLAQTLVKDGQIAEAAEIFEQAIRTSPADPTIFVEAGQLALDLDQTNKAQRWFDSAAGLGANSEAFFLGKARTSAAQKQYKTAIEDVSTLLKNKPDHAEALLLLGAIHRSAGDLDLALQALDKASRVMPDSTSIAVERARLKMETGQLEEALKEMNHLLKENSSDEKLWALISEAYQANSQSDQAVEALTRAVRLAPRNHSYRIKLGLLCMEAGQLDRALNELDTAADLNPSNSEVQIARGRIFEKRKEFNRALQAYQEAIALDPDQPAPHFMAGMILKKLKAYQEAGLMLKQAASLNPKDPDIMHQLAAVRALELVHGKTFQPVVES